VHGKNQMRASRAVAGLASVALFAAAFAPGCGSTAASGDEERDRQYREFLEKRRAKRWIELEPSAPGAAAPTVAADDPAEGDTDRPWFEIRARAENAFPLAEEAAANTADPEQQKDPAPAAAPAPGPADAPADPRAAGALETLVKLLGAPAPPVEERPAPAPDRAQIGAEAGAYSLEFRDLDIADFIRLVADRAQLNVVSTEKLEGSITLSLRENDLKEALVRVLESFGYTLIEKDGIASVRKLSAPVPQLTSRVFVANSIPVQALRESIQEFVSPRGKIVVNSQRNSMLVVDSEENVLLIDRYVRLLDVREKQVMIEAEIVEAAFNTDDELGVALELLSLSADDVGGLYIQDLLPVNQSFVFGVFSKKEAYRSLIAAFAKRRMVNILSSPRVATLNGQKAMIEVIERIPYIDSTSTTTTGGGTLGSTTIQQIEFADVGVTLTVTPSVGEDGFVKMNVIPEVKELTDFFQGVPVIDRRRVETNIVVPNEGTLVIGGLLRNNELEQEEKVPLLGDIPLLGTLFTRSERRTQKSELLVFITPTILDPARPEIVTDKAKKSVRDRIEENRKSFD